MQTYFIIKYKSKNFEPGTIVKLVAVCNNSFLVKHIDSDDDNYHSEWLMKYDIYPIINHDNFYDWSYNKKNQINIPSDYYILKNNNDIVVRLLYNNNDNYVVKKLNNNTEIIINKNELIKVNEL